MEWWKRGDERIEDDWQDFVLRRLKDIGYYRKMYVFDGEVKHLVELTR